MKIGIVVPIHNEEAYLERFLKSLERQTLQPDCIILVDDNSTDSSNDIIADFTAKHDHIKSIRIQSHPEHVPGAKVIHAFYKGHQFLPNDMDLVGKFDADLELPRDYFLKVSELFQNDPKLGMAGGNLFIPSGENWIYENISEKTKLRGPIKLYRNKCFEDIGGLKKSIGWDTVDGYLAEFYDWKIKTIPDLKVKHLKPTGKGYTKSDAALQGQAFKKMRYGFVLSFIALGKLAIKKKSISFFFKGLIGYFKTKSDFLVTKEEGKYIRKYRWVKIRSKFA